MAANMSDEILQARSASARATYAYRAESPGGGDQATPRPGAMMRVPLALLLIAAAACGGDDGGGDADAALTDAALADAVPSVDPSRMSACLDWSVAKGGPLVAYR